MSAASSTALVGVDWGTTSFRAFRISGNGAILDHRSGAEGIMGVPDGDFAGVLFAHIGDWLGQAAVPVLLSGMIGSRQGWVEAPYLRTPASLVDLAAGLVPVPDDRAVIRLVPGLATAGEGMPDVMRGEEVQVFGVMLHGRLGSGRFVLPGTHSKWVMVENDRIVSFKTYMTGEIFAACCSHTILGRLMTGDIGSDHAFRRGVCDGAVEGRPGALLNRLFGVRTAGLFGKLPATDLAEYLSGLLIGAELADGRGATVDPVRIIGAAALQARYRSAAECLGIATEPAGPEAAASAYLAIARASGLIA